MGRVAGSYGILGWIKVTQPVQALGQCKYWWIDGAEYKVRSTKEHSGTLLAQLAGLESREAALRLKGKIVAVPREALPATEEGIYYHADLVGMEVVTTEGAVLGKVKAMSSNGAQDLMEVAGDRTRLLPWVGAVIKEVDAGQKRIVVEWGVDW
jgi:16S rRNA processing protein RimM